jgi:hypothetical protein
LESTQNGRAKSNGEKWIRINGLKSIGWSKFPAKPLILKHRDKNNCGETYGNLQQKVQAVA